MSRTFSSNLSVKGLNNLKKEIRKYQQETLKNNITRFVEELSNAGIKVAYRNVGEFNGYIGFYKELKDSKYNYQCKAVMIGKNISTNTKTWLKNSQGDTTSVDINSLMMAEFGSGIYADSEHRGTFPREDGKPSKGNQGIWWYATEFDADGNPKWIEARGIRPMMPMYKAYYEMLIEYKKIAQYVFNS